MAGRRRWLHQKRASGRYAPPLVHVWIVAPFFVAVAIALSFQIYQFVYGLLADAASETDPPKSVNVSEAIRSAVAIIGLIGAALAGVYAYRKQRIAEGDAHRADAKQLADRYTTAAEQLGHDKAAVRLAGVYALGQLSDEWEEQRQVCIDVLCAYLRMPYETDPTASGYREGEREVRHTIIRVVREHLQGAGTSAGSSPSWSNCNFDFTGATFDGGNLSNSRFEGMVLFDRARFFGGTVSFDGVTFSPSSTVSFERATFSGGTVSFSGAEFFGGTVSFKRARFSGATVSFDDGKFSNGTVHFNGATFLPGSTVSFEGTRFSTGTVHFNGAMFSGSTVLFAGAAFSSGTVWFSNAKFSRGIVAFDGATFSG
ncbi:pentapeptide repeat-containing protein, partial [Streptomyces sp. SID1046]|uniref:pentapeptide repeat-containing protein n=1 Tax=Streptomyces sp. SID1046 TaxID=2690249 RepID=UPI00136D1A18